MQCKTVHYTELHCTAVQCNVYNLYSLLSINSLLYYQFDGVVELEYLSDGLDKVHIEALVPWRNSLIERRKIEGKKR